MENHFPAFGSRSTWAPNLIGNTLSLQVNSCTSWRMQYIISDFFRHILQEFQLLHCICISLSSVIKSTPPFGSCCTPWQHGDGRSLPHPPFATSAESMANGLTPVPHEHRIFDGTPGLFWAPWDTHGDIMIKNSGSCYPYGCFQKKWVFPPNHPF